VLARNCLVDFQRILHFGLEIWRIANVQFRKETSVCLLFGHVYDCLLGVTIAWFIRLSLSRLIALSFIDVSSHLDVNIIDARNWLGRSCFPIITAVHLAEKRGAVFRMTRRRS